LKTYVPTSPHDVTTQNIFTSVRTSNLGRIFYILVSYVETLRLKYTKLPPVLYGFEFWFLALKEKRRLNVSENMVLRIFGRLRETVFEEGGENYIIRKLIICILHRIYLGDQVKEIEIFETCSTHGEMKERYKILVGNSYWTLPFG
jgi:hypothetical protein